MRILFVWTGITRCAGDCWRALVSLPGVELKLVIEAEADPALEREVLHGLDYRLVPAGKDEAALLFSRSTFTCRPDVVFVVGWHSKIVRSFVERPDWANVPKVCCFDMPWRWKLRCVVARFVLRRYVRRFLAAYVPGRLGRLYAGWLGFRRIYDGFLAADLDKFKTKDAVGRRKDFLYVGRKAPEKRIDLIERAFARYRELGGTWRIDCCHTTPYSKLPQVYARHACLVLASEHDSWPLVALEAKAAGCEVIQSDRCGNRFELNTRVVKFGDVEALAREMMKVEGEVKANADGERRNVDLSPMVVVSTSNLNLMPYDCNVWAKRTLAIAEELMHEQD